MKIPKGHQPVMPYLMIAGAEPFIAFVQQVFKASLTQRHMREDNVTIQHAEVQIAGSTLMIADATEQWKPQTANLFVYVDDVDAAYKAALEQGATTVMAISDQEY